MNGNTISEMDGKQFSQQYIQLKQIYIDLYDQEKTNYSNFSNNLRKLIELENLEINMYNPELQHATYWLAQAINDLSSLKSMTLRIKQIQNDFEGMTFLKKSFKNLSQLEKLNLYFIQSDEYKMSERYVDQLLKGINYLTQLKQLTLEFVYIDFDLQSFGKKIILDQLSQLTQIFIYLKTDIPKILFEQEIFRIIKSIKSLEYVNLNISYSNKINEQYLRKLIMEQERLYGEFKLNEYQQSFEQIPYQWRRIKSFTFFIRQSYISESSLNKYFNNINSNDLNEINCSFKEASINTLKHILSLNNLKRLTLSVDKLNQTVSSEISINNSLEFLDISFQPNGFVKNQDDFSALLSNLQNLKSLKLKLTLIKEPRYSIIKSLSKSLYKLDKLIELSIEFVSQYPNLLEEYFKLVNGIGQLENLQSLTFALNQPVTPLEFQELIKIIQRLNKLMILQIQFGIFQKSFQISFILEQLEIINRLSKFTQFCLDYEKESMSNNIKNKIKMNQEETLFSVAFDSHLEEQLESTISFIKKYQFERSLQFILDITQQKDIIFNDEWTDKMMRLIKHLQSTKIHKLSILLPNHELKKNLILQFLVILSSIQQLNSVSLQFKSSIPSIQVRQQVIKKIPNLVQIGSLNIEEEDIFAADQDYQDDEDDFEFPL